MQVLFTAVCLFFSSSSCSRQGIGANLSFRLGGIFFFVFAVAIRMVMAMGGRGGGGWDGMGIGGGRGEGVARRVLYGGRVVGGGGEEQTSEC